MPNILLVIGTVLGLVLGGVGVFTPTLNKPVELGGLVHPMQEIFVNGLKAGRSETLVINSSGEWIGATAATTGTFSGAVAVTSTSANALAVGRQGTTDPVLKINANTASVATGVSITGAAAASGVAVAAISSGTNENLTLDAKGSGTLTLNGTATGAISLARATSVTGAITGTSASASSLAVGLAGATNPAFVVDSSTGSQAAGLKVTGAATGGTVAIAAIDSGSDTNLTINAKGTGTIGIGSVSTGAVTITPATTISGAATHSSTTALTGVTTVTAASGIVGTVSNTFFPVVLDQASQAISGAGAVTLTEYYTEVTNTGSDALTLADSTTKGQLKKVQMIVDPGTNSTLTFNTNATIVFADVGDYAVLIWNGADWLPIELGNVVDGATKPSYTPAS